MTTFRAFDKPRANTVEPTTIVMLDTGAEVLSLTWQRLVELVAVALQGGGSTFAELQDVGFIMAQQQDKLLAISADGLSVTAVAKWVVDEVLSPTSLNAIQNKAVHAALASKSESGHGHSMAQVQGLEQALLGLLGPEDKASEADAVAGLDDEKYMTAFTTKAAIQALASASEWEVSTPVYDELNELQLLNFDKNRVYGSPSAPITGGVSITNPTGYKIGAQAIIWLDCANSYFDAQINTYGTEKPLKGVLPFLLVAGPENEIVAFHSKLPAVATNKYEYSVSTSPVATSKKTFEKAGALTRFFFGAGLTDLKVQINGGVQQTIAINASTRVWEGNIAYPAGAVVAFIPTSSTAEVMFDFNGIEA